MLPHHRRFDYTHTMPYGSLLGPTGRKAAIFLSPITPLFDHLPESEIVEPLMTESFDMESVDYDDPAVEERWCSERRQEVSAYLVGQGVNHGKVGTWPAWHVAPYVSIWAIESVKVPGSVGWWVICGDLPCDYLSAATVKHPREAMRAFAQQWKNVSKSLQAGAPHPHLTFGPPDQASVLAPGLESRSRTLAEWAEDDRMWGPEYD